MIGLKKVGTETDMVRAVVALTETITLRARNGICNSNPRAGVLSIDLAVKICIIAPFGPHTDPVFLTPPIWHGSLHLIQVANLISLQPSQPLKCLSGDHHRDAMDHGLSMAPLFIREISPS